jgi:hypothetical protein
VSIVRQSWETDDNQGGGKMPGRRGGGDTSVTVDRVSAEAELVCYWFAKAWEAMRAGAPLKASEAHRSAPFTMPV